MQTFSVHFGGLPQEILGIFRSKLSNLHRPRHTGGLSYETDYDPDWTGIEDGLLRLRKTHDIWLDGFLNYTMIIVSH